MVSFAQSQMVLCDVPELRNVVLYRWPFFFFLIPLPYSHMKLLWCQWYRSITENKSKQEYRTLANKLTVLPFQFVCGLATFRDIQMNNSVAAVTSGTVLLKRKSQTEGFWGFSDISDFWMTASDKCCWDISASSCFYVFFHGSFSQQYLAGLAVWKERQAILFSADCLDVILNGVLMRYVCFEYDCFPFTAEISIFFFWSLPQWTLLTSVCLSINGKRMFFFFFTLLDVLQ